MKVLVVYSSQTGNTEKIARSISSAIEGSQLAKLPAKLDLHGIDLCFCGFWCDKGQPDELWKNFFESIPNIPCAIFGTLGGSPKSEKGSAYIQKMRNLYLEKENVLDLQMWQGKVDPKLLEAMAKMPGMPPMTEERKQRLEEASKHPTQEDCDEAAAWATQIVSSLE